MKPYIPYTKAEVQELLEYGYTHQDERHKQGMNTYPANDIHLALKQGIVNRSPDRDTTPLDETYCQFLNQDSPDNVSSVADNIFNILNSI